MLLTGYKHADNHSIKLNASKLKSGITSGGQLVRKYQSNFKVHECCDNRHVIAC
jgi:hypothetical protein